MLAGWQGLVGTVNVLDLLDAVLADSGYAASSDSGSAFIGGSQDEGSLAGQVIGQGQVHGPLVVVLDGAAVDTTSSGVLVDHGGIPGSESQRGVAFPVVDEPVDLSELEGLGCVGHEPHGPAGFG